MNEVDLCKILIQWLQDLKYEVYQEVQILRNSNVADIVAVHNKITWVIEVKRTFGISVLSQAYEWCDFANFVSIAVPIDKGRNTIGRNRFVNYLMNNLGIGLLRINNNGFRYDSPIREVWEPRFRRKVGKHLLNGLNEKQKYWAEAGNPDGKRWSPFNETVRRLKDYIRSHPGCTMKQLLDNVQTHYSGTVCAKTAIFSWINHGVIKGVRIDSDKKPYRLFLEKESTT